MHIRVQSPEERESAEAHLARALGGGAEVHRGTDAYSLTASVANVAVVADALAALTNAGVNVAEFSLGQPSLDEVFFALTGRPAEERTPEINA